MSAEEKAELTRTTKAFYDKCYPCVPPCDSYGICEGCSEGLNFLAGHAKGHAQGRLDGIAEVLSLLKSEEANEFACTKPPSAIKHPENWADWIENRMKEKR